jgi:hypothetical protein
MTSRPLDADLDRLRRRWVFQQRAGVVTLAVVVVLAVVYGWAALSRQNRQINTQQHLIVSQAALIGAMKAQLTRDERRITASCAFQHTLGVAPLSIQPSTGQPTALGVTIIVEARQAFRGQGCPGKLSAPSRSLVHWAAYFHLPAP